MTASARTAFSGLALVLLLAFSAAAKTLIVAKSGGTHASIQAGLAAAAAGDTVLVRPGVYIERVSFGKSGAPGAPISLLGEKGAILDGTGMSGGALVSIANRSHVRVQGFEVRNLKGGDTPIGISVNGGGTGIALVGNHVHHIESGSNAHGIAVYGDASTPISNLLVEGNEVDNCKLGQSESMVLNGNVAGFRVIGNLVHDNDNIGIDFIGFEGTGPAGQDQARDGLCSGNTVYNISSAANPTYGGERSADGIYVDGGRDIVIEGNSVDNADIAYEIASEHGGKTTSGITLRNNFAARSYQGNILVGGYAAARGSATGIVIAHNTTWQGRDGEIVLQHNCDGVRIVNNILVARPGQAYLVNSGSNNVRVAADNNLYFGAGGSSPGSWPDPHAVFANPQLADAPADLRLASGSPARDAAAALDTALAGTRDIDGGPRVQGPRPDIGADESGSGAALRGPAPAAGSGRIRARWRGRDAAGRHFRPYSGNQPNPVRPGSVSRPGTPSGP